MSKVKSAVPKNRKASLIYRVKGFERKIVLDDGTHLGRVAFPEHKSPRELPPVFEKARIAIMFEEMHVSRNHALMLFEDNAWKLFDLNSLNGTKVNETELIAGVGQRLSDGDTIGLSRVKLSFSLDEGLESAALLVGNHGFPPLRGIKNNLAGMLDALEKRKQFKGNTSTLYRENATRKAVLNMIEMYAASLTKDSLFVFYFCGNGLRSGLGAFNGTISPDDLYSALKNVRGRSLVLLDNCESSVFLRDVPPQTLVVTGEPPSGDLYEKSVSTHYDGGYPGTYRQGHLTRSFIKLFESIKGKIDLKRLADELGKYYKLQRNYVKVFARGSTFIVPSVRHSSSVS
jgi:hypothetical protein